MLDSKQSLEGGPHGEAASAGARRLRRRAIQLGAAAVLAVVAATPALAQDQDRETRRERGCYCVGSLPSDGWARMYFAPRGRMGVYLSSERVDAGARIDRVARRSPAEEAGLRAGDIITAINGRSLLEPLPDEDDDATPATRVSMIMDDVEPGDTVRVEYLRDGERRTVELVATDMFEFQMPEVRVALDRAREQLDALRTVRPLRIEGTTFVFGSEGRFGIRVADLDEDLGEYFGTSEGVLVTRVDEDSPLDLRAGDVIQRVGGRRVEDAAHLRQILGTYRKDETVQLEVLRKRQRVTVEGRAP